MSQNDFIYLHPFDYFSRWLKIPLLKPAEPSATALLGVIQDHPLSRDQTAQDYFPPASTPRSDPERFPVYLEHQDTWTLFLRTGTECELDPPVYFTSELDLKADYGIPREHILEDDSILLYPRFSDFLWQALTRSICLRLDKGEVLADSVCGGSWRDDLTLESDWWLPGGVEFPAGYSAYLQPSAIYIPDWGIAALDQVDLEEVQRGLPAVDLALWHPGAAD